LPPARAFAIVGASMDDGEKPARLPLRTLLVEDNPDDAELIVMELRRGGREPTFRRVETAAEMAAALDEEVWDVILSDYTLPAFSAPAAFSLMRERNLDVPFIVVSGTVGEDVAIEAMRTGVHDFMLKGQLRRLVPAIERELRDAAIRAERRTIQEQLVISDRMASVGTLATGVAHEINNPLAVVLGSLQSIGRDLQHLTRGLETLQDDAGAASTARIARLQSTAAALADALRDADEAGERVRTIVQDLRVFSRSEGEVREPVEIHGVLESSLRMARNEIRHRANIVRQFGDVPRVYANEARLGQVFLNLIVNAAQAIAEGKAQQNTITITTRRLEDMVAVEITDTGAGIAPEALPRIFDVFFTTKAIGVGTGLGLAICHRILTAMNGRIEAESRLGAGTTFRVVLPRARTGRTLGVPILPSPFDAAPVPRSVLAVEDEPAVGRTIQRLLLPHRVTVVTRAREALARIVAGEHFDVILCDVMMPELTGMDFHERLREARPDLADQVIFLSGGAFTPRARDFFERIPNPRIDKPIDAAQLRSLVEGTPPGKASALLGKRN
jgi:signal transduction histidine kinase